MGRHRHPGGRGGLGRNEVRKLVLLAILVLACGRGSPETLTVGSPVPTTSAAPATTSTSTTSPSTTTSMRPATTTLAPTTTLLPPPEAAFALTQVVFGEHGHVEISNYGGMPGDPGGHWLCKEPDQFLIPSVELEPGESLWVASGDGQAQQGSVGIDTEAVIPAEGELGTFDPGSGEFGLYRQPAFDDPAEAVSYVEWGESGHGCSPAALQAGIWVEAGFVAIGPDSFGIAATTTPPVRPDHWQRQVGG